MLETDLSLLEHAARSAGEIAHRYWKNGAKSWEKEDGSGLLTEADLAVDNHLKSVLLDARPDYGWLSEETTDTPDRLEKSRVFIVDPIDGTRSFASGNDVWALSLAVVENGQPVAAALFLPARDEMILATPDSATWNGSILTNLSGIPDEAAEILAPQNVMNASNWKALPVVNRHFRPSLAYRFALIANGEFDAMLTFRPAWEWDIAAGVLIATASGCKVTDQHGAELEFNMPDPRASGVIAANPDYHQHLMGLRAI